MRANNGERRDREPGGRHSHDAGARRVYVLCAAATRCRAQICVGMTERDAARSTAYPSWLLERKGRTRWRQSLSPIIRTGPREPNIVRKSQSGTDRRQETYPVVHNLRKICRGNVHSSDRLLWTSDELDRADLAALESLQASRDASETVGQDLDVVGLQQSQHATTRRCRSRDAHLDVSRGEQPGERAVQLAPELTLRRQLHVAEHMHDRLALPQSRRVDLARQHDHDSPAGRERVDRGVLRLALRDRVERDVQRAAGERCDCAAEVGMCGAAVDDVRRAERLDVGCVLLGGGRDDRREARELRKLDRCACG